MKNKIFKASISLALIFSMGAYPVLGCTVPPQINTSRPSKTNVVLLSATPTAPTPQSEGESKVTPQTSTPSSVAPSTTNPNTRTVPQTPSNESKPDTQSAPTREVNPSTEAKPPTGGGSSSEKRMHRKHKESDKQKPEQRQTESSDTRKGSFVLDNFKVIQCTLNKLGVSNTELDGLIKQGKSLSDVLREKKINTNKFKRTLMKEYNCAIKDALQAKKISKDEAKMLKSTIKQKVKGWQPK